MQQILLDLLLEALKSLVTPSVVQKAEVAVVAWLRGLVGTNQITAEIVQIIADALGVP